MRKFWPLLIAVTTPIAIAIGCAASADESPLGDDLDASGNGGGGSDAGTAYPWDGANPFDSGNPQDSGNPTDGGGDGSPGSCSPLNQCMTARDVGSVSGDTKPVVNSIFENGSAEEWVFFKVKEDSSTPFSGLSYKVQLTSPPGANYDIFLYHSDNNKNGPVCDNVVKQSTNPAGQLDEIDDGWGDQLASSDTRAVYAHIKHISGPCGPGNEWTLVVQGKQ